MKRNLLLFFALLIVPITRAANYSHYSEWITDSEISLTPHPYNLDFSPSWPKWCYQIGIELDGMLDVCTTYGNEKVGSYLKEYPATMIDKKGNIAGVQALEKECGGISRKNIDKLLGYSSKTGNTVSRSDTWPELQEDFCSQRCPVSSSSENMPPKAGIPSYTAWPTTDHTSISRERSR